MNSLNPFLAFAGAVPSFNQPILPGWTLNIDSNNSSSPRTEGLVVSRFSYGRQLGQISDALAAIIAALPAPAQAQADIRRFLEMKARIDLLKEDTLDERAAALAGELAALKRSKQAKDKRAFDQAAALLRPVL
ncbi:MAG: hypothetical protein JF586_13560 [Burkholderiales bacterium]|nr:hypothetical protein [Burkholderiales bacterium]